MFDITEEIVEAFPKVAPSPGNTTLVSMLPFPLRENKPAIMPGYFQIPGARMGEFEILRIGESIHWIESPFPKMPPIKMTAPSKEVARSIVNDYMESQLGTDSDAAPGLFFIEGHLGKKEIIEKHSDKLSHAFENQRRWFTILIRLADDDWQATHQHRVISDIQRHAAKAMGITREWINVTLDTQMVQCPLCKDLVRPDAIIHNVCGFILKPDEYAALQSRILPKGPVNQLEAFGGTK